MDLFWDELGHLPSAFFLCGATVAFDALRYWSRKYRQIHFCVRTPPAGGALKLTLEEGGP